MSGAKVTAMELNLIISQSVPEALEQALDALEKGALIVAPTETRYGLLARADSEEALERLYSAKKRPVDLVTAVFLSSVNEISHWAEITPSASRLIERFLPGPLTLVLPATEKASASLSSRVIQNREIGIRITNSVFLKRLMQRVDFPVTATSANISGSETLANIKGIAEQLGESITLYIDGGELSGPVSTVVRCAAASLAAASPESVEVLRQGALSSAELQSVLSEEMKVKCNDC